jgi:GNAT superfamily N-acetyltransferase
MEILRALPAQAPALTRIALAGKRHWRYPERWIEIWTPQLTVTAAYVEANPTYLASVAGEPIGFHALLVDREKRRAELDHLWLLPEWIGKGQGRILFAHAMATAAELGARTLGIEAEPLAESFYLRMGARRRGERITVIDGVERMLPLLEVGVVASA